MHVPRLGLGMHYSFRHEVNRALAILKTDRKGLARRLELSVGTLRSWEARGAPAEPDILDAHLATREDALGALEQPQGLASLVTRRMGPECSELDNPGKPFYL